MMKSLYKTAVAGKEGIIYGIILDVMTGVFQLTMMLALMAAILGLSSALESSVGLTSKIIWSWCGYLGLPALGFWIFSAACRVRWWREFEAADAQSDRQGDWMRDLPAVLCLDFVFGVLRSIGIIALCLAVLGIILNSSVAGVWVSAIAALYLLCLEVVQPAWMAERMISGPGLVKALVRAVRQWVRKPLKALAFYFIPGAITILASWTCGLMCLSDSNPMGIMLMLAVSVLMPCLVPVFWLEFMRRD